MVLTVAKVLVVAILVADGSTMILAQKRVSCGGRDHLLDDDDG